MTPTSGASVWVSIPQAMTSNPDLFSFDVGGIELDSPYLDRGEEWIVGD